MAKHRVAAVPYNLVRIFAIRARLLTDTLVPYVGTELVGDWFGELTRDLARALDVQEDVIEDSIRHCAGEVLLRPSAFVLAWRLAGNIDRLRDGTACPQWFTQSEEEWLPTQVLDWQADKTSRGKPVNVYTLRILAGTSCPMRVIASWPVSFTRMLARQIGFSNRRGKTPFQHPAEFVRLRLRVLADPARSKPGQLGFWEVAGAAGLTKWNRSILQKRARIGFQCPENYTHACHVCPYGYDECPAACRPKTIYDAGTAVSDTAEISNERVDNPNN